MRPDAPVRSLVLWFPDWPVAALSRDAAGAGSTTDDAPVAIIAGGMVTACSATARADGVRRGQRRRDAQSRCPGLRVVDADDARDHRAFAPLVAALEERAPGVQIIRPGLCALRARGPARYYGGELEAARVLLGTVRGLGVADVRAGVADGPFTAEQAARITRASDPVSIVPTGGAAGFLAPLPITALADPDVVALLARLGVQTLGDFSRLDAERVRERLGEAGMRLHRLASGLDSRPVEPRVPPPELHREVAFEPPLEIAEQVAFALRIAADEFISRLGAIDLVCTELRVELTGDRGERSERVWLHPHSFDAAAVVDRVRWQLAEEAAGEDGGVLASGVALVRVSPEAVDAASHHAPAMFGAGTDERVHHVLSRVQALLGHRGVLTAEVGGGRWLAERQVLVPWGDRTVVTAERTRPWPGSLPDPLPGTVFPEPVPVQVVTGEGGPVAVDERDRMTATPSVLVESGRPRAIREWAGPWPIVERSWDAARSRRAHRFQVVDADRTAWLLVCAGGSWIAEGRYD